MAGYDMLAFPDATSNKDGSQPEFMSKGMSSLVDAISLIFTEIATDSLSRNSRDNVPRILALLEKTTTILKGLDPDTNRSPVREDPTCDETATAQSVSAEDLPTASDEHWELVVSKTTGKILGICHDLSISEGWYNDEAKDITSSNALISYNNAVRQCRERVEIIIEECHQANRKFRDLDFDLDDYDRCLKGLESTSTNPYAELHPRGNAQVRTIFDDPQFYVGGVGGTNITQGNLGDDWFLAGISTVLNNEAALFQNYVEVDGGEEVGVYGFVFHRDGEWVYEVVDDYLYTKYPLYAELYDKTGDDRALTFVMLSSLSEEQYSATFNKGSNALYFARSRNNNEIWVPLLEKAFAKAHGDYKALGGGFVGEAVEDLTGGITTEIKTKDILDSDILWEELLLCNEQFMFGCWTPEWARYEPSHGILCSEGIISGHAYSVMKAVQVHIDGAMERLVLVRNPWGSSEWTGRYSDGSEEMTAYLLETLGHKTGNDGDFYMSFKDLLRKFEFIDRIRLITGEWSCAQIWTNLQATPTSTFVDTKLTFTVDCDDFVVISLSQLDDRYFQCLSGRQDFVLEFRVEKVGPSSESHSVARSKRTTYSRRSVNTETHLTAGKYRIIAKVSAESTNGTRTVRETVRHYASTDSKGKLMQLVKNYNFAHAKRGIRRREDCKLEKLVDCDGSDYIEQKSRLDSNINGVMNGSQPPHPCTSGKEKSEIPQLTLTDLSTVSSLSPHSLQTQSAIDSEQRKSKIAVDGDTVVSVSLRIFTRKAKVIIHAAQE